MPASQSDGLSVRSRGSSVTSSISSAGKRIVTAAKRVRQHTTKGALLLLDKAKKVKTKVSHKRLKTTSGTASRASSPSIVPTAHGSPSASAAGDAPISIPSDDEPDEPTPQQRLGESPASHNLHLLLTSPQMLFVRPGRPRYIASSR